MTSESQVIVKLSSRSLSKHKFLVLDLGSHGRLNPRMVDNPTTSSWHAKHFVARMKLHFSCYSKTISITDRQTQRGNLNVVFSI